MARAGAVALSIGLGWLVLADCSREWDRFDPLPTEGTGASGAAGGGAVGGGGAGSGKAGGDTGGSGGAGAGGAGGASGGGGDGGAPSIVVVAETPTILSLDDVPSLTFSPLPSAGNAIIVGITCFSEVDNCTISQGGVTDNQGNPYSKVFEGESVVSSTTHGVRGSIFIAESIGVSSGTFVISVDPNGSVPPDYQSVAGGAIEVSGLAPPPSLDASGGTLVLSGSTTTATTDLATTQANELAVAVLSMRSNDNNMLITPDAAWTSHHIHQNGVSGPPGHSMVSQVQSATGKISHTWTHDVPTRGVVGIIATFKGAQSGGG